MPSYVIPSGAFVDVRVLSILIGGEPISLHYFIRRAPTPTSAPELFFITREIDIKILRPINSDGIGEDKSEAANRLIINSVCQDSSVYATLEGMSIIISFPTRS